MWAGGRSLRWLATAQALRGVDLSSCDPLPAPADDGAQGREASITEAWRVDAAELFTTAVALVAAAVAALIVKRWIVHGSRGG